VNDRAEKIAHLFVGGARLLSVRRLNCLRSQSGGEIRQIGVRRLLIVVRTALAVLTGLRWNRFHRRFQLGRETFHLDFEKEFRRDQDLRLLGFFRPAERGFNAGRPRGLRKQKDRESRCDQRRQALPSECVQVFHNGSIR